MEDREIGRVQRGRRRTATHVDGPCQHLRLPCRDLGGMHAKLGGQLRPRLLALDRGESHRCLEGRPMMASRSRHRLAPWFAPWGVAEARRPLATLSEFLGPPLNTHLVGRGVAIFSDYAVHGGGDSFYYKGKYKLDASNNVSAQIEVAHYSGTPQSVLGPWETFRLTFNDIVTDQGFTLSRQIVGEPHSRVTIALKKLGNLIEA